MIKIRTCTDCNKNYPLTNEFFYLHKNSRTKEYRFIHRCRKCQKIKRIKDYPKERTQTRLRNRLYPEKQMFRRAKMRAKKFNIEFTIALEDIIIPEYCPILNLKLYVTTGIASDNSPSLDKIDPIKGYTSDNIRVISRMANIMKAHATEEQLKLFAKNILTYIKNDKSRRKTRRNITKNNKS